MPGQRPRGDDSGFTLVEVLVAMAVISTALLGLIFAQLQSLTTITVAKQRQQATALATQTMEQVRSLSYATVLAGMSSTDLTDPNIVGGRLRPAFDSSIDEPVLSTVTSDTTAPLRPHVRADATTFLNGIQFTVRTYLTRAGADVSVSGVTVTVAVTWSSAASGHAKIAVQRSRIYQVSGCSGTTLRTFSGPCQTFLYGQAGSRGGSLAVRPGGAATTLPFGSAATGGTVTFPVVSALAQAEQLVSGSGTAATSGATLSAGSASSSGSVPAVSTSRTDPETGPGSDGSRTSTQTGSALTTGGVAGTLALRPGAADTTSVLSVPVAGVTPACIDTSPVPLTVTSGQVCSSASASLGGAVGVSLDLAPVGTRDLPPTDLVQVPATTSLKGWAGRYTHAGTIHCTTATSAGCVAATSAHRVGTTQLGQVPPTAIGDTVPAGFAGYLARVDALSATAWSESGTGATNPAPAWPFSSTTAVWSRQGTVSYWTGSGYASLGLATSTALADVALPPVSVTYAGGTAITVTVSGSLRVKTPSSTTSGTTPCVTAACSRTSDSGAVTAQLHYVVSNASSAAAVADFWVDVDLGSASAKTSYRSAS